MSQFWRPPCPLPLLLALPGTPAWAASGAPLQWAGALLLWTLALAAGIALLMRRRLRAEDEAVRLGIELSEARRARQRAEQALTDTHAVLARLVRQQENVRDRERGRIARDLHEDLGQRLLALRIELSLLHVATKGIHPGIHQKLTSLLACLDHALRFLRGTVHALRPLALDEGLRAAMERQLAEFSRLNGIAHEFVVGAGVADLCVPGSELDAMLYRVLQEALSNVARHAQASMVQVALTQDGQQLSLHVRDDGQGRDFPPADCGCGLAGMRERVRAAGGELRIQSEPGAGTLLSLAVPLAQEAIPG